MVIKIYPDDIVRLCLWDSYVYYIIGSEKEGEKILKENLEFEISERDALIIGLLKVIQTDNLIHRFNNYIIEFLTNKSIKDGDFLIVKKKTFDQAVDKYMDKFPIYWEPDFKFERSLDDLKNYIRIFQNDISKIEIKTIIDKNLTMEFYNSNNIKKLLKFQY